MNLTKKLKNMGYDLIDGPIRNHKNLQLWEQKPMNKIGLYHSKLQDALISDVQLNVLETPALDIDSTTKNEYKFNLGITVLEGVLESLNLGDLGLDTKIKSGKKVSISYDKSVTREIPIGEINHYLSDSDFTYTNAQLLKNLNRDNLIIVTGVLLSKNLVVQIDSDLAIDSELAASLNSSVNGKLEFSATSSNSLSMKSTGDSYFPVAVKAYRIDYDKGVFNKTTLVTDNRKFF